MVKPSLDKGVSTGSNPVSTTISINPVTVSGETTKARKGGGFKRKTNMEYIVMIASVIGYITVAGLLKIVLEDYSKTDQRNINNK